MPEFTNNTGKSCVARKVSTPKRIAIQANQTKSMFLDQVASFGISRVVPRHIVRSDCEFEKSSHQKTRNHANVIFHA
jgi:hypothetical protein